MKREYKYLKILLIIITLIWTLLVVANQFKVIDNWIYNLLISLKCDFFTNFFKVITFFGSVKFIVILNVLVIIYGIFKKNNGQIFGKLVDQRKQKNRENPEKQSFFP